LLCIILYISRCWPHSAPRHHRRRVRWRCKTSGEFSQSLGACGRTNTLHLHLPSTLPYSYSATVYHRCAQTLFVLGLFARSVPRNISQPSITFLAPASGCRRDIPGPRRAAIRGFGFIGFKIDISEVWALSFGFMEDNYGFGV